MWRLVTLPSTVAVVSPESKGVHESCLFSYNLLAYVRELLRQNAPPKVVLELITELEFMHQKVGGKPFGLSPDD